jgi:hypothetical protein
MTNLNTINAELNSLPWEPALENRIVNVGLRFNHARVLDTAKFDGKTPQLYEVTKIARGTIWYAPIYDAGIAGSERRGKSEHCQLDYFYKIAK